MVINKSLIITDAAYYFWKVLKYNLVSETND